MEEQMNISQEEAMKISTDFSIVPLYNKVVVTLNRLEPDNEYILSDNEMDSWQYVIAKGTFVKEVDVNDKVLIDLDRLVERIPNAENQHEQISQIKLELLMVDGISYAIMEDRFLKAKYSNNQPVQN
jgi:hypothetical protein